jgi:pentapeptide repeat protein
MTLKGRNFGKRKLRYRAAFQGEQQSGKTTRFERRILHYCVRVGVSEPLSLSKDASCLPCPRSTVRARMAATVTHGEEGPKPARGAPIEREGCPREMHDGRRCGRAIHRTHLSFSESPVCLMHSGDPQKHAPSFQAEIERILREAGEGLADFSGFIFPTQDYKGREFKAKCVFAGATFTIGATFVEAMFTQRADFSFAKFPIGADFPEAAFTEGADFRYATLSHANFIRATFTQHAEFSGAEFTGQSLFLWARFTRRADFAGARFEEGARFSKATFAERAVFRGPDSSTPALPRPSSDSTPTSRGQHSRGQPNSRELRSSRGVTSSPQDS